VAILSALLSFLVRQIGKILQAVFGWSITTLFGRLPSTKQTAVSVALLLSVLWPVFVIGLVFPDAAAWIVAFLPLKKWMSATALRILWCVFAVITPAIVGLITHWVSKTRKGGIANAMIQGYPLALGFAAAFLITVVTVPIVKLVSLKRRWSDEHVYVQPRDACYEKALHELAEACVLAGVKPEVRDVPTSMALATKVIRFFARGAVSPMVEEQPKMLRTEHLELYLYPADLLIRGDKKLAAHVRAMMTRTKIERDAYLVGTPEAQKVQDEICIFWETMERNGGQGKARLAEIRKELDTTDMPFEDWSTLERVTRHVEQELAHPHAEHVKEMAMATQKSTAELVKEAVDEAKQLVRIEVELAKEEAKKEVKQAEGAGIAFAASLAFASVFLSLVGVAIVLAVGSTPVAALIVAVCFLVVAGVAAGIGYALIPKKPLEHTVERAETDLRQLKEHAV